MFKQHFTANVNKTHQKSLRQYKETNNSFHLYDYPPSNDQRHAVKQANPLPAGRKISLATRVYTWSLRLKFQTIDSSADCAFKILALTYVRDAKEVFRFAPYSLPSVSFIDSWKSSTTRAKICTCFSTTQRHFSVLAAQLRSSYLYFRIHRHPKVSPNTLNCLTFLHGWTWL